MSRLLAEDFPGAPELRAQVPVTQVSGGCTCGCPTIDLVVGGDVPPAVVTSRSPVSASVDGASGDGLIVFVDDGRLSRLEHYSSEDDVPREFPELARIHPYT